MKQVKARIIDMTHLELEQPINGKPGEVINISIPDEDEDLKLWKEASLRHFISAYSEEDSVYDNL